MFFFSLHSGINFFQKPQAGKWGPLNESMYFRLNMGDSALLCWFTRGYIFERLRNLLELAWVVVGAF